MLNETGSTSEQPSRGRGRKGRQQWLTGMLRSWAVNRRGPIVQRAIRVGSTAPLPVGAKRGRPLTR